MTVVDRQNRACPRGLRIRDGAGKRLAWLAIRREHANTVRESGVERLRDPDGKRSDIGHRRTAAVPGDAVLPLEPLACERRLAVAGGRNEQEDSSLGFVEELGQPRALDDEAARSRPR